MFELEDVLESTDDVLDWLNLIFSSSELWYLSILQNVNEMAQILEWV